MNIKNNGYSQGIIINGLYKLFGGKFGEKQSLKGLEL